MSFLITLLMLVGLGAMVFLLKSGKASPGLTGGILTMVVLGAGISLTRSSRPPQDPMVEEKIAINEAMGWRTAQ